jgi:hypothetical protein
MSAITIKDESQDVWPQDINHRDYLAYEIPGKTTYSNQTVVTQKTLGAHYLDMRLVHNGFHSGDGGNGGLVELEIETDYMYDHGYDSIQVNRTKHGFKLIIEGQSEREQLVKVLQTALDELKTIK